MEKIKAYLKQHSKYLVGLFITLLIVNMFTEIVESMYVNLALLIVWGLLAYINDLSYKSSVRLGLLGLVLTAVSLALNSRETSERFAILTYLLLLFATIQYLYENRDSI